VEEGGNLMALERLDGTFAMGASISIGKARTAVLFKKPTRFFEELINKGRTAMTAVDGFTPLIGGIPIIVGGEVVGGIGVSGAASANQDEELALAGAAAFSVAGRGESGQPGSTPPATGATFIDSKNVVDGSATLVTGGKAIDTKEIAPNEIRGTKIEGGQEHQISKGEVIVIPNGVPHQFTAVTGELHYFVC